MEALNEGGGVTIALSFDDDFVKVDFSDNGPGIEPERLAHIFEPYHTTKKGGSGLGLMVCRRIVRDHGGEIDVESKQAQGTRFTVRIPRKEKRIRRLT
jgi:signal transduction histidine kinase